MKTASQQPPTIQTIRRHLVALMKSWYEIKFNIRPTDAWVEWATPKIDKEIQAWGSEFSVDRIATVLSIKQ